MQLIKFSIITAMQIQAVDGSDKKRNTTGNIVLSKLLLD